MFVYTCQRRRRGGREGDSRGTDAKHTLVVVIKEAVAHFSNDHEVDHKRHQVQQAFDDPVEPDEDGSPDHRKHCTVVEVLGKGGTLNARSSTLVAVAHLWELAVVRVGARGVYGDAP